MKLCFHNLPGPFSEGTRRLLALKNCQLDDAGMPVFLETGDVLQVQIADGKATVIYPQGGFFRALGLLLEHFREENYSITEEPRLEKLGLQIDFSRNCAMRLDGAKKLMDMLALMGYNQMYLYMEDMYCLPGREYFGYMRGRYSPQELKELDDYADQYGIELIPSIQTLGHMEQYLRWDEAAEVRDTARELLADSQTTLKFVEEMIKAATAPFRTKKVVLGLDETHNLGLGKYLDLNGYAKKEEIFYRHLTEVFKITDRLGLEGMICSDMFFRMLT